MSRPVSEASLIDWENNEYLGDDLHCHFENKDQWDWTEIRHEWLRLNNLMFDEDVQLNSPREDLACAAICQGYNGAIAAVAAALGVDSKTLGMAVSEWAEGKAKGDVPAAIGFDGLKKGCEEREEELRALIQRRANN